MDQDKITHLVEENDLLRNELRVAHEAAELTAELVVKQFEQTEREKQRFQTVAANLEGFRRTLDQISDGVFMLDSRSNRFIYVNQGGLMLTGYSEKELSSMTFTDLIPSLSTDEMEKTFKKLRVEPHEPITLTSTKTRKNGVMVPVEIFLQYISPEGRPGRFFSLVRNISERLLEEKEKEKMQAKLLHTQKLESVGALAAGIAHEINTPIQYIGTNLQFFEESCEDIDEVLTSMMELLEEMKDGKVNKERVEALESLMEEIELDFLREEIPSAVKQAREGVNKVSSLVNAMKAFSHPGSRDKEIGNINEIIETTLQVSRNEWKYVADVELDLAADMPNINCHVNEIGQVLLNIIVNGAHAINDRLTEDPQGAKGVIHIGTEAWQDSVEIKIADNGKGIPQEIIDKIFDPFFTTKDVGKGTGQGLAIARDVIISKHKGTIEVNSEPGRGAEFVITLPKDGGEEHE